MNIERKNDLYQVANFVLQSTLEQCVNCKSLRGMGRNVHVIEIVRTYLACDLEHTWKDLELENGCYHFELYTGEIEAWK